MNTNSGPTERTILRAAMADREIAKAALEQVSGRKTDPVALDAYLEDPTCYLVIALQAGTPVGVLAGQVIRRAHQSQPQFLLYEMDVVESVRRQGIGRALIERYRDEAYRAGASEVWVLTNASNVAAMRLYEQNGMVRENPDDVMWVLPLDGGAAVDGGLRPEEP